MSYVIPSVASPDPEVAKMVGDEYALRRLLPAFRDLASHTAQGPLQW